MKLMTVTTVEMESRDRLAVALEDVWFPARVLKRP